MNFLERIPTRWLLIGAGLACLALWAAPSSAQTTGDPVNGKALFEDAPNLVPSANLTNNCVNCHGSVQDRRKHISGDSTAAGGFADISFSIAADRFLRQVNVQSAAQMGQYRALDSASLNDIAAYIADTPKTSVAQLSFSASAINTNTLSQSIDLINAMTAGALTVNSVAITGTGAARFTSTADNCTAQTLAAGSSCRISVRFSSPDTTTYTAPLTLTMHIAGTSTAITRVVSLSGQVGSATPPPSPSDSGGGALGWVWLSGLALATLVLARRRA